MIISHKHRFIFFAVPKTATHTIRVALRSHLGKDDWEQQILFGDQLSPIPEIAAIRHGHISVREIKPHLTQEIWSSYFKFGFVRNPYERFVSTCFFLNRQNPNFGRRAMTEMEAMIQRKFFRNRVLGRPQYKILVDESNLKALDYIGRYESLQESYDNICERIGIRSTKLSRENSSSHSHSGHYYSKPLKELVTDFYRLDFELFNYPMDGA